MYHEQCIKGDRQAFEALLIQYEKPVFNAAYRMLNSREDASDVTQTVFLKVYENFDSFDPSRRFFSWVYRITLNESINWLSKQKRLEPLQHETAADSKSPEQEVDSAQLSAAVQAALMTIKADYRSAVRSRLYSARQLLKATLTNTDTC